MRILLGYSEHVSPISIKHWIEAWLSRLRGHGFDVDPFCLTLSPPGPRLSWPELDALWRRGDKTLLRLYENLAQRSQEYDVFVNFNGINVHPEFVRQLPTFNVYGCFDDPESSDDLSRPVAAAYDLAMVGNIAALDMYRSWGVREVSFWPLGFRVDDYNAELMCDQIMNDERDMDIALLCERISPWRSERLDRFATAFPQGAYYGHGWPRGFLPEAERVPLLQRSKIGVNIHNSTGPINFRTFVLPANGVMQVCDNKSHLGQIFEIGKEAVGFDTIEEAIDLCRYYLNHNHDDERRSIAAAGWERALRDYNEAAVFKVMVDAVEQLRVLPDTKPAHAISLLQSQRRRTIVPRTTYNLHARLRQCLEESDLH